MGLDYRRRSGVALTLLVTLTLGVAATGTARAVPPESTSTLVVAAAPPRGLEALLKSGPHPWLGHAALSDVRDSLRAFYGRRDNTLAWIEYGRPSLLARSWVEALGGLETYGIPPTDVDAPQLAQALAEADAGGTRTEAELGDLDVAISASIARTLRALHSGRLSPASVDSNLILLHRPLAVSLTLDSLSQIGRPQDWIARVQPSFHQYRALIEALGRYREWAADTLGMLPSKPPRLTSQRASGGVARVKLLLERAGDLRWGTIKGVHADSIADNKLIAAITRFQRRHRLPTSSRLDSLTWLAMHEALDERVAQMGRTLEQYRWLPHELIAPLLFVNIPAFRLDVMTTLDEPDSNALHINVVVGTAFKTQTPVLTAALLAVDFMPTWDVPPSIARDEVQPSALADAGYLAKNHMDLIRQLKVLPPTRENIEAIGHGVRVRQRAGPDNPLGRVKFVMPNDYDVYLHDTPARTLFGARQRDFSHGCIRLEDPAKLALFALRDRPDWPASRIDSTMNGLEPAEKAAKGKHAKDAEKEFKTIRVRLPNPMLVAIVYATVEARANGRVQFNPDVYGHDRTLELLLGGASKDTVVAERLRARDRRHPPLPPPAAFHAPMWPPPHPPGVPPAMPAPAPAATPTPEASRERDRN